MNNEVKEFLKSVPFVIFFLVLVLLISMLGNKKIVFGFLVLVLLSMMTVNSAKFSAFVKNIKVNLTQNSY